MAIALGKPSPDDSPLCKPKQMLKYTVDLIQLPFNTPCDWSETVTEVDDNIANLHKWPGENDSNHKILRVMQINR